MKKDELMCRWKAVLSQTFCAHLADVDGNLTDEPNARVLPAEIIERIQQKLKNGVPFGLVTARSYRKDGFLDRAQREILKNVPPESARLFYLFPEQGAAAVIFCPNKKHGYRPKKIDLVRLLHPSGLPKITEKSRQNLFVKSEQFFARRSGRPTLAYLSSKKHGFMAKVIRLPDEPDTAYEKRVQRLTKSANVFLKKQAPNYQAFCTRHSIYFALKGVTKALALACFSKKFKLPLSQIVGTDDQGDVYGVGWSLTKHKAGFATQIYNPAARYQVPLPLLCHKSGMAAWIYLDDHLTYVSPLKQIRKPD